jgi:phage I-like protein
MATVRLNDAGNRNAKALIGSGAVNKATAWSFSAEEGSAILGDPPEWSRYADWHLGIRTGTSRKSKQGYAYPFGKQGKVYRAALVAARQRAAQQGHSAVFNAAGALLQAIDGKQATMSVADNMMAIGAFAAEPAPIAWEELPELVIQLLPFTGDETVTAVDGRQIRVTDESIQSIADRFNARENPLVLDYEHNTFNPLVEMGSLAAGWIQEVWPVASDANVAELADDRVREAAELYGPGVYAVVHLTEKAAGHVEAREYQFVSPVVVQNDELVVLEIMGAGLTNDPALDGMMPIAAKRSADGATMESARDDATPDAASEGSTDPESRKQGAEEMDLDKITALVGRKVESESEALEILARLKADAETGKAAQAEVEKLQAERLEREASEAVAAAIADGRLAEEQQPWALGLFRSDRKAWDAYVAATKKGTFSKKDEPPQGQLTDDGTDQNTDLGYPESVKFFGQEIPVNKDQLEKLNRAVALSRSTFNGDLARAIRAVRR